MPTERGQQTSKGWKQVIFKQRKQKWLRKRLISTMQKQQRKREWFDFYNLDAEAVAVNFLKLEVEAEAELVRNFSLPGSLHIDTLVGFDLPIVIISALAFCLDPYQVAQSGKSDGSVKPQDTVIKESRVVSDCEECKTESVVRVV